MIGRHLLADLHGVEHERLADSALLDRMLLDAARASGLTPVAGPLLHQFPGGGLTGVVLLAESHIAFHTYPERGYLALDVFTCGDSDPSTALEVFRRALDPAWHTAQVIARGRAEPSSPGSGA